MTTGDDAERPVRPRTRTAFDVAGATLFAPDRVELTALFRRLGRDKDLGRASLLDRADVAPA